MEITKLFKIKEVMRLDNVGSTTVHKRIKAGKYKVVRFGRAVRITADSVLAGRNEGGV